MAAAILTAERVREILDFSVDPPVWRIRSNYHSRIGATAGFVHVGGYRHIKYQGREYKAHRLVWLAATGEWPANQIDHINGIRTDNRFVNLRDVTQTINQENHRVPRADNKCGALGVSRYRDKYKAQITLHRERLYLGVFDTVEGAHAAYVEAKRRLHPGCTI